MDGKTVIVVAHRLSTIAHLDRILVFEKGEVVEDGSHHELLRKGGAYARLWRRQSEGFVSEDEEVAIDPPLDVPLVEEKPVSSEDVSDDPSEVSQEQRLEKVLV